MSDYNNKGFLIVPPNKLGIVSACGPAVDSGKLDEDNVEEIFEKIIPILETEGFSLTAGRSLYMDEKDLELLDGPKASVYLPPGIEGNFKDEALPPPTTKYADDEWTFNRYALRQITGD